MRTIRDQSPPGPIEQDVTAAPSRPERIRRKAQWLRDQFAALPAGQRASFTMNGVQIQIVSQPSFLRDPDTNAVIGIAIEARAQDANGRLPQGDGWHYILNPPFKIHDGTFHLQTQSGANVEIPNFTENPVAALQQSLYRSVVYAARLRGWQG